MGWLSDLWKHGFTPAQRARSGSTERYTQAIAAYQRELADLSASDARVAAEQVLAASRLIRAVPWQALPPQHPQLAPTLREFFREIQRVEVPNSERYFDVAELAPLDWVRGYLRLGTDGEHTHLAIRQADESIYVLADDVDSEDQVETVFATIHHWILWLERNEQLMTAVD